MKRDIFGDACWRSTTTTDSKAGPLVTVYATQTKDQTATFRPLIWDIYLVRPKGSAMPDYAKGLLLKQGLDWDWTGDGLEMDWSISHS